jgi:hypothetical protein
MESAQSGREVRIDSPGRHHEARKIMRYPIQARVSFSWKDENGNRRQDQGTSRDVSEKGTFVLAPRCPPVGVDVRLRMLILAPLDAARILNMEFKGRVLRVEQTTPGGGKDGFAVLGHAAIVRENNESTEEENPSGNGPNTDS